MINFLGVGGLDHNGSVTHCSDQQIKCFLEAERPTQIKNIGLQRPDILTQLLDRISVEKVDRIGIADKTFWSRLHTKLTPSLRNYCDHDFDIWPHHDCHVASALIASPWDRTLCVSIDGKGDNLSALGAIVSREGGVEERLLEVSSAHSLGRLWWATSEYCGFPGHHSAGKTMALAAFGSPFGLFDPIVDLRADGSFTFVDDTAHPDTFRQVSRIEAWIDRRVSSMISDEENIFADVAASLQQLNNRVVSHLIETMVRKTGMRRICLAGGVALNGLTNQFLLDNNVVDELFVVPCCDDRGLSLGAAALSASRANAPIKGSNNPFSAYLGPPVVFDEPRGWSKKEISLAQLAQRLAAGEVVAWFAGGDEAGPRALGHRSLLATPTKPGVKERLHLMKERETFRPFGCAVDAEEATKWFQLQSDSPYMVRIAKGTKAAAKVIPSVIHFDGTSGIQTVRPDDGSTLWPLFEALSQIGHPRVVLNTSFNESGEPLVHSIEDAATTATRLGAELLVIDGDVYAPE